MREKAKLAITGTWKVEFRGWLRYMSTAGKLLELEENNILKLWSSPHQPLAARRRQFWVDEHVEAKLDAQPWPAYFFESQRSADDRRLRTHVLINQFIEGQNLSYGLNHDDADVKCLKPMLRVADWRVFALRPSHGRRTTRVIGEFAAPDAFVALEVLPRGFINDWDKIMGRVDARWLTLFGTAPPLHWGNAPSKDLIGNGYSDV